MTIDWRGKINIGKADLREIIKAAYDLSAPQGLGFLHHKEGGLSDEEIDQIVNRERAEWMNIVAGMDYVNGRAVKMTVRRDPDTQDLYIDRQWFDHGRGLLEQLLGRFGVDPAAIDKADEEAAEIHREWQAEQAEKAKIGVAYLREKGGRVPNPALNFGSVSAEIRDGLHAATDTGLARYDRETREYVLAEPTAE